MKERAKTILIVDDDSVLRGVVAKKLQDAYFEVIEAGNGEEGLDAALKNHPDLILLDELMPKLDGLGVLKKLRQDEWGKSVPVIFLTNIEPDDKIMAEITLNEPSFYLVKANWSMEEIVKKCRESLQMDEELI